MRIKYSEYEASHSRRSCEFVIYLRHQRIPRSTEREVRYLEFFGSPNPPFARTSVGPFFRCGGISPHPSELTFKIQYLLFP